MSLRSILDRSRDALYSLAVKATPALSIVHAEDGESVLSTGNGIGNGPIEFSHFHSNDIFHSGGWNLFSLNGNGSGTIRNLLFWLVILALVLLLAALTNPNESSFRSHLTELSFRRHLADIRSSDSQNGDKEHKDGNNSNNNSSTDHMDCPTPFRFANHVAISLRTPSLVYRTFLFFSIALTPPLGPPSFLTISDPASIIKKGGSGHNGKEKAVVFIGFLGHWTFWGPIPFVEWFIRLLTEWHKEKSKRRERAGVTDLRAVPSKEDTLPTVSVTKAKDSISSESSLPLTPPPALSRRPSTSLPVVPAVDLPDSPLVISLKAELTTAQSALLDLKAILFAQESATDSNLTTALDDLRHKRKDDDVERQELKSKTKSLEEQKRQAESARKEAEKKLKSAEMSKESLNGKIVAAKNDALDLREQMVTSEKNVRSVQEDGARHVVETQGAIEEKQKELSAMEAVLVEMEQANEDLGKQVKAAEERLKVASEAAPPPVANAGHIQHGAHGHAGSGPVYGTGPIAGVRATPEEEMMMMAAAYEAAAQEGYLHQNQNSWAHQAAQYMAEAGMPYLGQDYTARPHRTGNISATANTHHHESTGYEDFGLNAGALGPRDLAPPIAPTRALPPAPELEAEEEEVEIDPGSPNGTSFLPQGLFRSLEGDQTPVEFDIDDHDSSSDSGDELWRSPYPEPAQPLESSTSPSIASPDQPKPTGLRRLLPPSRTPPGTGNTTANAAPVIPGLPALPGSRRWFSGTSSNENVAFSFMHPIGTASNDSLLYEPSPFAPSASEKKALALSWGPLSKYRWARGGTATNTATTASNQPGQESLGIGLPRRGSVDMGLGTSPNRNGGNGGGSGSGSGSWLASRFSVSQHQNQNQSQYQTQHQHHNLNPNQRHSTSDETFAKTPNQFDPIVSEEDEEDSKSTKSNSEKKPFRFFSLRKTPSSTS